MTLLIIIIVALIWAILGFYWWDSRDPLAKTVWCQLMPPAPNLTRDAIWCSCSTCGQCPRCPREDRPVGHA